MPTRGGKREGAGRPKGAVSKATADIKAAASEYSQSALTTLAEIMGNAQSPAAARVAAANAILDRAHGKPKQSVELEGEVDVNQTVTAVEYVVVDAAPGSGS
ncbi:hypothetical protein [Caulobacter sp. 602-1]|uniref:hypothetical protein n=1 Tax=Caulobacter sp. 602-1 TaxID=2492472 RepID=UPI000F63536E|nr:hypothetical protein [Caulobacter sp. 602-1]RRN64651.1 hypothetical protein EIK80_11490 [Caulobacter sp. 602-1]